MRAGPELPGAHPAISWAEPIPAGSWPRRSFRTSSSRKKQISSTPPVSTCLSGKCIVRFPSPVSDTDSRPGSDAPIRRGDLAAPGAAAPTSRNEPPTFSGPIGFKMVYDRGRIRMEAACAACHMTLDPATGNAIEGPANPDINMGLILALAPDSAAYFGRTDVDVAKRDDLDVDPRPNPPRSTPDTPDRRIRGAWRMLKV